jgi:hypothetical protein
MTSRSDDWVLAAARLISSASSTWPKTGPGRNRIWPSRGSKTVVPVTSLGSRSGVNCTRRICPPRAWATALASVVFPVPGTSSSST